jgi:hypothetical protein
MSISREFAFTDEFIQAGYTDGLKGCNLLRTHTKVSFNLWTTAELNGMNLDNRFNQEVSPSTC